MSYAVIKTGGKQYSVIEGQTLLIERLPDDVGATVELSRCCSLVTAIRSSRATRSRPRSSKAEIVEHLRGPKLRVFKFKPKRGYKRRTGHRQELTRIKITVDQGKGSRDLMAHKKGLGSTATAATRTPSTSA